MSLYEQRRLYRDGEIPDMPQMYTREQLAQLPDGAEVEIAVFHTDKHARGGLRCGYFGPATFRREPLAGQSGLSAISLWKDIEAQWPLIGPNVVRDDLARDRDLWQVPGPAGSQGSASMGDDGWLDVGGADGFGEDTFVLIRPAGITGDPEYSDDELRTLAHQREAELTAGMVAEMEQIMGSPMQVREDGSISFDASNFMAQQGKADDDEEPPAGKPQLAPLE
jgi:hypothetical protein